MCLYTRLFSIISTNKMRPQFEKSYAVEKDKKKFILGFFFFSSILTKDLPGWQIQGRSQNKMRRLYLLEHVSASSSIWGVLTFLSAHLTVTCALPMIKGSENRKKMQCRYWETQLTFLLKLLLTLYFFCGSILTSFLAALGSVGLC